MYVVITFLDPPSVPPQKRDVESLTPLVSENKIRRIIASTMSSSRPSGSSSSAATSVHTPLSQVCRWEENETILVCDSIESDGRFVLGTLVANLPAEERKHQEQQRASTSIRNRVLWLCCSAMTDQLTLSALSKSGSSKSMTGSASLPELSSANSGTPPAAADGRLTIRSIPTLLSRAISSKQEGDQETPQSFDTESFVKHIYRQVKEWVRFQHEKTRNQTEDAVGEEFDERRWVVLDDLSTLGALVGDRLAYGLVLSLQALSRTGGLPFGLAMRCSNDADIEAEGLMDPRSTQWFGGAAVAAVESSTLTGDNDGYMKECPWERQLVELADTVVDVCPLASGYTREAHGRLIFSRRGEAAGASSSSTTTQVYNYCLTDNQALAIRISR